MNRYLILAGLIAVAGCKKDTTESERVALAIVAAARTSTGIGPELVDSALTEKVRCMQLVRRTTLDTFNRDKLLAVLNGEGGPDRQYAPADRPQRQRERAARGLAATTRGDCKATPAPQLAADRVKALTDPIEGAPSEVLAAQQELQAALQEAEAVRLDCQPGHVGVLLVKAPDGKRRVIDLWELGASSFEVNPNDPTMK